MLGSGSASLSLHQRWQIAPPQVEQAHALAQALHLSPLIAQVLLNRGVDSPEAAQVFLNPELPKLPSPLEEFADLPIALELLLRAIADRQYIAICGDYDADGMTSTALLLRALRGLGAIVDYAIPSRMQEGYGINQRIVEEFYEEGGKLILTVDNGIAAHAPIALARELGIAVIVTDHHDIPPTLPDANAILNPKLIRPDSPYRGVAGVGVAYILAICLAQSLQKMQDLTTPLIELFTLGTIADLAPLTGVNRRWVKRGLKLLPKSRIPGVQALIQVAGLSNEKALKPEAIGFRLGPRINAIGRLADPQIVIELLTTDDDGRALELAMKCEQVNQLRQRLCELIEQEAIAWCQATGFNPQRSRVLVIVQPGWHHGVIGIVASRLVERYGVPVFIGTYEQVDEHQGGPGDADPTDDRSIESNNISLSNQSIVAAVISDDSTSDDAAGVFSKIRGSARGIPEFDVFEALQFSGDLLEKFGGHRAAGGFTLEAHHLEDFRSRLEQFAHQVLSPDYLRPLVSIDAQSQFTELTFDLHEQLDVLHPCGIENPDPIFWTADVRVVEQRKIGRDQSHLKLVLMAEGMTFEAIAWRWGEYYPLPSPIDVAYRLKINEWNGNQTLQLELVGVRAASNSPDAEPLSRATAPQPPTRSIDFSPSRTIEPQFESQLKPQLEPQPPIVAPSHSTLPINSDGNSAFIDLHSTHALNDSAADASPNSSEIHPFDRSNSATSIPIEFYYSKRKYVGEVHTAPSGRELRISNLTGQMLIIQPEQRGFLQQSGEPPQEIDIFQPHYFNLVRSALMALEIAEKNRLIQEKDALLAAQAQEIARLKQQLSAQQVDHTLPHPSLTISPPSNGLSDLEAGWFDRNLINQSNSNQSNSNRSNSDRSDAAQSNHPDLYDALENDSDHVLENDPLSYEPVDALVLPDQENDNGIDRLSQITSETSSEITGEITSEIASPLPPSNPKTRLREELGEIWQQLDTRSQKDLIAATEKQQQAEAQPADTSSIDYSDAGLRLCSVIEREVIQPFFKQLHQFLLENEEPCEIGGVSLRPRKKYTLGMLPPLLAPAWQTFQDEALTCDQPPVADLTLPDAPVYLTAQSAIDPDDRDTVQVFLLQWEHPLSNWLQTATAASQIAQTDKLLTIAADPENPLFVWQFQHLHQLILGSAPTPGILQQLYGDL